MRGQWLVAISLLLGCSTPSTAPPAVGDAGADATVDGGKPPCDLLFPEGTCPVGENCVVRPVDAAGTLGTKCVPTGTARGAAVCTKGQTPDPCAPGYDCVFFGGAAATSCAKHCRIDHAAEDCGGGEATCVATSPPTTIAGTTYGFCSMPCDLSNAATCGTDGHCIELESPTAFTLCVARTGAAATPCAASYDCDPGSYCESGTCHRWCSNSFPCPNGGTCKPTSVSVNGAVYGTCL